MLMSLGHEVYLYGAEGSDAECTEHIVTHTLDDIRREWGDRDYANKWSPSDPQWDIGYDWKKENFRADFDLKDYSDTHKKFVNESIVQINNRRKDDDFLLLTMGYYQRVIAENVNLFLTCEPGIGYTGTYAKFRAYESSALMHYIYGRENPGGGTCDGTHYNRVIPNYFDPKDFTFCGEKEDYVLFVGRLIRRKGIQIAHQAATHAGKKLVVAGQGATLWDGHKLASNDFSIEGDNIDYVGSVGSEERNRLMGRAQALLCPTIYIEPFGGVNVEAQLCGTPAIATTFGVFRETIEHGKTGFICDTMDDFVKAIKASADLDPKYIRAHAERYLMDNVKMEFEKWFIDLYRVWESTKGISSGWSWVEPEKSDVNWPSVFEFEKSWWAGCTQNGRNTYVEERKQIEYAGHMQLAWGDPIVKWIAGRGSRILDVGGGQVSLLLKTRNLGKGSTVWDPMPLVNWVKARYEENGIEYIQKKAEDLDATGFDEVWMYNLLQHVEDPERVARQARKAGKILRVFEFLEHPACLGHPHVLYKKDLDNWFGEEGKEVILSDLEIWGNENFKIYAGVFDGN